MDKKFNEKYLFLQIYFGFLKPDLGQFSHLRHLIWLFKPLYMKFD